MHISALCPKFSPDIVTNFCVGSASSGKTFLLPVLTVKISCGKRTTSVSCLIDSGSQRSYLNKEVLKRLKLSVDSTKTNMQINTFIDNSIKEFSEMCLSIDFQEGHRYAVPFLVNDDFNLNFSVDGLNKAFNNLKSRYQVAENFDGDYVRLEGLLGVDSMQYLQLCELITCMGGKAFNLQRGIVPFGNVDSFLTNPQLTSKYANVSNASISQAFNEDASSSDVITDCVIDSSIINFVLDPVKTCFDPLGGVMSDTQVEHNLDRMFSIESLGFSEEASSYDEHYITKFNEEIKFVNGNYHVMLPWTEKIKDVKSNYSVSNAILGRVFDNLHRDNLYEAYKQVLQQQIEDDILEPIPINEINVEDHIWIPHRPVVKHESNVTTKVRIVLNCSLKIGDSPSLNEAAYPGVDLMNDLLMLLVRIRANKYLVASDIKQAFLMIKLARIEDRNRFSILWRNKD